MTSPTAVDSLDVEFQGLRVAREADQHFDQEKANLEAELENKKIVFTLIGNVNAGKSSTINALTGVEIAGVGPLPGHTKEVKLYRLPRFPNVTIADTPGLEDVDEEVSKRARDFVETDTDIILFFINATVGVTASVRKAFLALQALGRPMLVLLSKTDALDAEELPPLIQHTLGQLEMTATPKRLILIAPKKGQGIQELTAAMATVLAETGKDILFAKLIKEKDQVIDRWVYGAATGAFAIGALPIPGSDTVPLTVLQVGLVMKIAAAYEINITRQAVLPLITEMAAGRIGKMLFRTLLKAAGWLGGPVGEGIAATIAGVLAASMTYGIGMAAKHYFKNGMHENMEDLQETFQAASAFYRSTQMEAQV